MLALDSTAESEDYTDSSSDTKSDRSPTPSNERLYRKATRNLQNQLFDGRVENPPGMHFFYIPGSRRDELITYDTIKTHIQLGNAGINTKEVAEFSEATVSSAKNLFAILACLRKGGDIVSFLKEGISDIHLPFLRCGGPTQFNLKENDGKEIKNIKKWNRQRKEDFDRFQWWLLTPFFSIGDHHDLAPNAALPFVPSTQQREEDKNPSTGAYSEVSIVQLHDNQHDFWGACVSNVCQTVAASFSSAYMNQGTGLQVAIKKLKDNIEKEFEKEHTILKILGNKPHDHLVKLLASYKHRGHYHLIFPRANSNLRTYWESYSNPSFDRETVLWTLWQMKGIASGLNAVHDFKVTIPLSVDGNFKLTQDNQRLGVKAGEEWYGHHGDIKPENILWFERTLHSRDGRGVLQIADFGLGRFHGRESRTRAAGYHIFSSPTYEPPECHVHLKVSRAYDLWSLGCLFLEFLAWLLDGSDAIEDFAKSRSEDSFILNQEGKIKDDYFWTLWFDGGIRKAKPRKGVQDWATKLRQHEKCSMLIRDLLDLIMDGLLQIDPEKRITSRELYLSLKEMLHRAETDKCYLEPSRTSEVPEKKTTSLSETLDVPSESTLPTVSKFEDTPNLEILSEINLDDTSGVPRKKVTFELETMSEDDSDVMESSSAGDVQPSSTTASTERTPIFSNDAYSTSFPGTSDQGNTVGAESGPLNDVINMESVYSDDPEPLSIESYINEFATMLFHNLKLEMGEQQSLDALLPVLEQVLRSFSLKIAHEIQSLEIRAEMVRIRRYRA